MLEVLNSLNARRAPIDGVPDGRSLNRRNADALIEAMTATSTTDSYLPRVGNARTWCSPWDSTT